MLTTLITGGSKGIGKAIVDSLASNKHQFINLSRNSINDKCINYKCDISNIEETYKLVSELTKTNNINNVIVNAGITDDAYFHKMKLDAWKNVINSNFVSVYGVLHPIINQMRTNNGGNIIFISSVNAQVGVMGQTNYSSSKNALIAFNRCLALENSSKNIKCNVISPGYTNTDMIKKINDNIKDNIKNTIPLKRFGEPEDILPIVKLLLFDNNYLQGENINVNGGLYMK